MQFFQKNSFIFFLAAVAGFSTSPGYADPEAILDEAALNRKMDPCQDFYEFSCGGWLQKTQIPADKNAWTRSFSTIDHQNKKELNEILSQYGRGDFSTPSRYAQQLGNFYAACMKETNESSSLQKYFDKIESLDYTLSFRDSLSHLVGRLHADGVSVLFNFYAAPDFENSSVMMARLDQGGLGLPDREYYLSSDEKKVKLRGQYLTHVKRVLRHSGYLEKQARKLAAEIVQFETELAKVSLSRTEQRDPQKTNHRIKMEQFARKGSYLEWEDIFVVMGAPTFDQVNVSSVEFFDGLNAALAKTSRAALKAYLKWNVIRHFSEEVGGAYARLHFEFYRKTLQGQAEPTPRWEYCVATTDSLWKDALGEAFVRKTFGEEGKTQTLGILGAIQKTFRENLGHLEWMDESTRKGAVSKLEKIQNKMGYPDRWTDFSQLKVAPKSHFSNVLVGSQYWVKRDLSKIGRPVDRSEWEMSPPTVNAYYDPTKNEIAFPAGILQAPFFSRTAPMAAKFGGIGMVIGHEFTHGFDDEGRQYDPSGNLKDWWSPRVAEVFSQKAQCLVDQYSRYTVLESIPVNGQLTLGENIADLGGAKLAFHAYQSMKRDAAQPAEEAVLGLTGEQQFFVAFAQTWCSKRTPELERKRVLDDPHSPPKYRVNGVVVNLPEFAEAFGCRAGAPMAPVNRCAIW